MSMPQPAASSSERYKKGHFDGTSRGKLGYDSEGAGSVASRKPAPMLDAAFVSVLNASSILVELAIASATGRTDRATVVTGLWARKLE